MLVIHTIAETREFLSKIRREGKSIGFVPTMGALHAGHLKLVQKCSEENDCVVVSIFVNPTQFNNPEDLKKYPRNLEADVEKLTSVSCDLIFAPSVEEMYPQPDQTRFDFGILDKVMEGQFRPGHFNGVGIVVRKLFEIVEPHRSYFGEKDFQQLAIIRNLVRLLQLPVEIVACPTVREPDGLAMSSRNERLNPDERAIAPSIYQALLKARDNYSWFTPDGISKMVTGEIEQTLGFDVEYASVVDTETLMPLSEWEDSDHAILCVAVFLGEVRLIDNMNLY
ncbi:MAG: pantoate--beta-alanine ligase [Bacteroidetes bacterium]|nr:pantoate--beta-alanine ligase [Bacteroidota bacterium]